MRVIRTFVSLTIAAALAGPALAQQKPKPGVFPTVVYKCVDDRGKVYYSDKVTPECREIEEMNRQGRVVKKHETLKPGVAPKLAADSAGRKDGAEKQRRDRALTATYTSEQEIDVAGDRSLAIPLQSVKTAENRLAKVNQQLFELKTQANRLAGQQKAIPPHLLEEINAKQNEVSALEAELQQKMSHADSVRARYEADKLRYRELKTAGR
jgi:DNA repair exonuclease SbcCD ATPase subunit